MATSGAPEPLTPHPPASTEGSVVLALPPTRKLSEELALLIATFERRTVTLREVIVVLQHRSYDLLLLLLSLPFLLPIPLPGLSTVLGTVIAIIAARIALGQRPWLPARLLDRELPPKFFSTLLNGARRVLRWFEVMLRPRHLWLTAPPLPRLHALVIFTAAFVLLLPLPPGTNFTPALCIVIMAGGLLERDGLFIIGGYIAFALNIVFFILFAFYGEKILSAIWHWLTG